MADQNERIAKLNYKQAIIVAIITAASTIAVTLISSGFFGKNETVKQSDCGPIEKKLADVEKKLDLSIRKESITGMSDVYFRNQADKNEVLDSIRALINYSEKLKEHESHYTYKLFLIKKIMLDNPKGNINTRIQRDSKNTYAIIQEILNELEYYQGPIDGDRMRTREALVAFQSKMNELDSGYFDLNNYGIFGNRTLMTIRSLYERQ